jgi:hypothetical protein
MPEIVHKVVRIVSHHPGHRRHSSGPASQLVAATFCSRAGWTNLPDAGPLPQKVKARRPALCEEPPTDVTHRSGSAA